MSPSPRRTISHTPVKSRRSPHNLRDLPGRRPQGGLFRTPPSAQRFTTQAGPLSEFSNLFSTTSGTVSSVPVAPNPSLITRMSSTSDDSSEYIQRPFTASDMEESTNQTSFLSGQQTVVTQPLIAGMTINPPGPSVPMPSNLSFESWLSLIRAFQAPPPPFPEFSGLDHEDPQKFLVNCERYFSQAQTDENQKTQLLVKGFRGEAQKWWNLFKDLSLSWVDFKDSFNRKYCSPTALMRLQASLYSQKQGDREPVAIFLQQKYLLSQRLVPSMAQPDLTILLMESLKPTLRRLVRPTAPKSFSELMEASILAEQDEADCTPRKPVSTKEEVPKKVTPEPSTSKPSQLPQCRFCPERHYHRDCPVLATKRSEQPSENWRAPAVKTPTTAAASTSNQQ